MDSYQRLLEYNKTWVKERLRDRVDYFTRLQDEQTPEYMWIGCSDSRVPAETVTGCQPGDLFVHRNVANLVVHTDLNMFSVLHYAVEFLGVKHVIVCGHYGCGGVKAALSHKSHGGVVNKWLRNVKDVWAANERELLAMPEGEPRLRRMVELNVVKQVKDLSHTSLVQQHWRKRGAPWLHGWVYDIHTGLLAELCLLRPEDVGDDIYRYEDEEG